MKDSTALRGDTDQAVAIRVRNVERTFNGKEGVRIGRLDITLGRITALVGPSGCGKSTLMHLISGMSLPEKGAGRSEIRLTVKTGDELRAIDAQRDGWKEIRRQIGFIFQDDFLISAASGRQNLDLSLATAGRCTDKAAIDALWAELGLDADDLDARCASYSGGMKQRASIARALVRDPTIIFADEPTASLDPRKAEDAMDLLVTWVNGAPHRTLVLVTHDIEMAARVADEVVVLVKPEDQPGQLAAGHDFPLSNPGKVKVIEGLMYGVAAPSPPDAGVRPDAERGLGATTPDRSGDRSGRAQVPSQQREMPEAVASGHWANTRRVAAIGGAISLAPEEQREEHQPVWRDLVQVAGQALFYLFVLLAGMAGLPFILSAVNGRDAWSAIAGWAAWAGAADLAGQFLPGQMGAQPVLTVISLALLFVFLLVVLVFRGMRSTYVVDAVVYSALLLAGVVLMTSHRYAQVEFEREMSNPNLQPIQVRINRGELTDDWIDLLQGEIDQIGGDAPQGGGQDRVFGRYHSLAANAYFAVDIDGAPVERCEEAYAQVRTINILAPTATEPLGVQLPYRPYTDADLPTGPFTDVTRRPYLGDLSFEVPRDTGAVGNIFDPVDGRDAAGPTGQIILTPLGWLALRGDARDAPTQTLCVDVASTRSDRSDDTLFRIEGFVSGVPKHDVRSYDAIVALDVGAMMASRDKQVHGPNSRYDLAAIWVPEQARSQTVRLISELEQDKVLSTLPGFQAFRRALVAADQSAASRRFLMLFVAAIGAFVMFQVVAEILNRLNREFAVARAFGARPGHLILFMASATVKQVLFALLVTALSIALLAGPLSEYAFPTSVEALSDETPTWWAFQWVGVCFVGGWLVTIVGRVFMVIGKTPSIAQQMQDAG